MAKRILRTAEAAEYVGLAPATLEKKRLTGGGPRFVRLGGRAIGYDIRQLDAWLDGLAGRRATRATPASARER